MINIENSKVLVIGGAGFIGSFFVRGVLKEPGTKVIGYDKFTRGKRENIAGCLQGARCSGVPYGGVIWCLGFMGKAF